MSNKIVASRTFCCCIPVRFGVFILSLAGVILSTLIAAAGWVQVAQIKTHHPSTSDAVALWLHSGLFTLLALLSLFGFIGSIARSRNSVAAYSWGLLVFLVLSIVSGAYTLWAVFRKPTQGDYLTCLAGARDDVTKALCGNNSGVYKGVLVAIYIIIWLCIIYAYVVVDNYVDQLDDENAVQETRQMIHNAVSQPRVVATPAIAVPAYANTGYAFSHPNQSYGIRPNGSVV